MKSLRVSAFAGVILAAAPLAALAQPGQVTIITPDSVHIYSTDPRTPGLLLDSKALRLQNEWTERESFLRRREQEEDQRSYNLQ